MNQTGWQQKNSDGTIDITDGVGSGQAVAVGQMNTQLATKANTATTLAGYGITDAQTKLYSGNFSQSVVAVTTFTVTIGVTLGGTTYETLVTPTVLLSAAVFYVTNKTTTTFDVVFLSALTGVVKFDWQVTP